MIYLNIYDEEQFLVCYEDILAHSGTRGKLSQHGKGLLIHLVQSFSKMLILPGDQTPTEMKGKTSFFIYCLGPKNIYSIFHDNLTNTIQIFCCGQAGSREKLKAFVNQ